MKKIAILASACLLMLENSLSADVTLVRDGQPAATIVIPAPPTPTETLAAEELRDHLRLISGAELPIRAGAAAGTRILIGRAAAEAGVSAEDLEEEFYRIRTGPDWLAIAGHDGLRIARAKDDPLDAKDTRVGTLFGVYGLLDGVLGVRWLWPGPSGTVVPQRKTIVIPPLDLAEGPKLLQRQMHPQASDRFRDKSFEGKEVDLLPNDQADYWARETLLWERRQRMGSRKLFGFGHAFGAWWGKYHQDHPEYFATRPAGAKRVPKENAKLCVSNPDVTDRIIADWQKEGAGEMVRACPNDGRGFCTCPRCRAWDLPVATTPENVDESMLTYRYVRFWNALAEKAHQIKPDAWICGYAYSNYRKAPEGVKLADRVILGYAAGIGSLPMTDDNTLVRDWEGWSAAGAKLFLRPNWFWAGHMWPYLPLHQAGDFLRHAYYHGMLGTSFDSLLGHWASQGAWYYLMARLQYRPEMSVDELLAEYCSAFGAAAGAVREHLDYWEAFTLQYPNRSEAIAAEHPDRIGDGRRAYVQIMPYLFTDDVLAKDRAILDRAARLVDNDPPIVRHRVEFLRLGLEHVRLTTDAVRAACPDAAKGKTDPLQAVRAAAALRKFRRDNAATGFDWTEFTSAWEINVGDFTGLRLTSCLGDRVPADVLPTTWWFQWDPQDVGVAQKWYDEALNPRKAHWPKASVDRPWEKQDVGHAWAREHDGKDYDGIAWYRTTFSLPADAKDRKVSLLFGAVDESCKVWVNGRPVGEHPFLKRDDWETPFEMDITSAARPGAANDVAVRVEDRQGLGGIWKLVWLMIE